MTPGHETTAEGPLAEATLVVIDPNGRRTRVPLSPFPFRMGRAPDNNLVLRDSRISRNHALIARSDGGFVLEDLGSRHGIWVNGERVRKSRALEGSDRIEFGVPDGYQIHFTRTGEEIKKLLARPATGDTGRTGSANLEKLRAVLEVARSLQSSFSTDDVLNTVLDAALAVTGAERGFLLLFNEAAELQVRSARSNGGGDLQPDELRVPRRLIQQALESRRDLFSMSFDPSAAEGLSPGNTITDLELRSVVCVPLVHVNLSGSGATQMLSAAKASAGVLYMDSRVTAVDLAGGNRELLQTLAIEASTVLENARLIEEQRVRQRMEEELDVARRIQHSLMPRELPDQGWFVVCGSSESSHQVGGDYYDVVAIGPETWSLVVADVSGKGVSSALLASFLQGAFLSASSTTDITDVLSRINTFLNDRSEHGKYATMFYSKLDSSGRLTYANAGHCAPLLVRAAGEIEKLEANSTPVGLVPDAPFVLSQRDLRPGDRIVLYTDGVTEAQNDAGDFFGRRRLREAVRSAGADCAGLHAAIQQAILDFTAGAEQADDLTLVVVEYRGNR
ncbi:MAG TPA: SpoIIE family protein phosphatase [Bryobacteraceae bacterium]|jgi:serine phosphatase RsbU (regulator of sigma subunit)|nr:SpoIIE family protein phosphatase [Bryobacteraceae bacterium]